MEKIAWIIFFGNENSVKVCGAGWEIKRRIHDYECRLKGNMWGSSYERDILQLFLIQMRRMKQVRIIEIFFHLPNEDELLLCCDGASRGNPGNAGYGFVARNHSGMFVFAESGGLGFTSNYVAEYMANIRAMEWAVENQHFKLIIQSDSKDCITSLKHDKIPWFLLARWQRILSYSPTISYRHVFREINFSADHFAKEGLCRQVFGADLDYIVLSQHV
ncbi:uncharacterized protein LOC113360481 [Papaver somniferum]|uniref:uncharacterized protein LOC113360481 n=1 Tax=Papaver somniferum TaxID=3469 RepID=UPI000E6F4FFB|nr:uncharacterized protein LOC113360481 [Papaver somniferum]